MTIYVTREGDTIDSITWRFYADAGAGPVRQVLLANLGLADYGPLLPAGVEVVLPELAQPEVAGGVRLWD